MTEVGCNWFGTVSNDKLCYLLIPFTCTGFRCYKMLPSFFNIGRTETHPQIHYNIQLLQKLFNTQTCTYRRPLVFLDIKKN
jgi:hypothetical protein